MAIGSTDNGKSNEQKVSEKTQTQIGYKIPDGYEIFVRSPREVERIDKDFDNDGINDLAVICTQSDENEEIKCGFYLFTFMSKTYLAKNKYYKTPLEPCPIGTGYHINYEKSVIEVGAAFGTGRYLRSYKFKYYPNLSNMRLIGYDEESFGNAVQDGAFTKSVNLLTSKIEIEEHRYDEEAEKEVVINKVSAKISVPVITLASFDEKTLTYLDELGQNYLKNN